MRRNDRWTGCLAAVAVLLAGAANAGPIYRQVDGDGRITFTDTPQTGAERLVQDAANIYRAPPKQQQVSEPVQQPSDAFAGYESVRIESPGEEALRANDGRIRIVAATQPALQAGHRAALLLDGEIVQQSKGFTFDLTEVDRGRHELAVRIVDGSGHVLAESRTKVVHLLRAFRRTALK